MAKSKRITSIGGQALIEGIMMRGAAHHGGGVRLSRRHRNSRNI